MTTTNNKGAELPEEVEFMRWWKSSKYCQVVFPKDGWEQIARDGWMAHARVGRPQTRSDAGWHVCDENCGGAINSRHCQAAQGNTGEQGS